MKTEKIFVVPYCHADWAWVYFRRWHEKRYVLVIEEVLALLKQNPAFRWYMDTYITEVEPFLRFRPERVKELRQRVKEGRIAICGTYTNLRPSMTGEETQIRDILIGQEIYQKVFPGIDLSVYASTVDVSVGHPQTPQVLALAGYKYLRFWRPHAALSLKKVPLEFFWQGIDGSTILCSRGCYGGLCNADNLYEDFKKEAPFDTENHYNSGVSPTGLRWLCQGGDDCRPLWNDKLSAKKFTEEWNRKESAPIRFATPPEAFREIDKKKEKLPIVKGSLDPCEVCYNAGWGGTGGLFSLRQENEFCLAEAEKWLSIASLFGYTYPHQQIRELWEDHLLACAHATQWLFEEDFREISDKALLVKFSCERIKQNTLSFLKGLVSTQENSEALFFNSLPFEREEKVPLTVSFHEQPQATFGLRDGSGRAVPYQVADINLNKDYPWEHRVIAKVKLPACGYTTLSVLKNAAPAENQQISFDAGWTDQEITSVTVNGKRYETTADAGFGTIGLYHVDTAKGELHVGPITSVEKAVWSATACMEDGQLYKRYVSEGSLGKHRVRRDIFVYKDEPRLELRLGVDWKEEDGFLALEWPKLFNGTLFGDMPFGVEEKLLGQEPFGADACIERQREKMFYAKSFVNWTDGSEGISYVNYDGTHYYLLHEKSIANILLNSFTKLEGWERFINARIKGIGQHLFVSHLVFYSGDWKKANIPQKAQSLLIKPEIIFTDRIAGEKLPAAFSFLSIRQPNLIMTAWYREKKKHILRFYESAGKKTKAVIDLPFTTKEVRKTDLEGRLLRKVKSGRTIHVDVKPWEIVTLEIC